MKSLSRSSLINITYIGVGLSQRSRHKCLPRLAAWLEINPLNQVFLCGIQTLLKKGTTIGVVHPRYRLYAQELSLCSFI